MKTFTSTTLVQRLEVDMDYGLNIRDEPPEPRHDEDWDQEDADNQMIADYNDQKELEDEMKEKKLATIKNKQYIPLVIYKHKDGFSIYQSGDEVMISDGAILALIKSLHLASRDILRKKIARDYKRLKDEEPMNNKQWVKQEYKAPKKTMEKN